MCPECEKFIVNFSFSLLRFVDFEELRDALAELDDVALRLDAELAHVVVVHLEQVLSDDLVVSERLLVLFEAGVADELDDCLGVPLLDWVKRSYPARRSRRPGRKSPGLHGTP